MFSHLSGLQYYTLSLDDSCTLSQNRNEFILSVDRWFSANGISVPFCSAASVMLLRSGVKSHICQIAYPLSSGLCDVLGI